MHEVSEDAGFIRVSTGRESERRSSVLSAGVEGRWRRRRSVGCDVLSLVLRGWGDGLRSFLGFGLDSDPH